MFSQPSSSSTLSSRPSVRRRLGTLRWRDLVDNYHQQVGKEVARLGGRVVNTAGDGVFATFDGPARAIKCARAVRDVVGTSGTGDPLRYSHR